MTGQTPLRLIDTNAEGQEGKPTGTDRDALSLSLPDRVAWYVLILTLLLLPLVAGQFATPHLAASPLGVLNWFQAIGISLIGVLIALALGMGVVREWRRPVAIGPVAGLAGGALGLVAWASVSLFVHPPLNYAGLNVWIALLSAVAVGGLISRLARDRKALITLLLVVVAAGSLAGGWGVNEYLDHWKQGDISHRVFGTFINPDFLAGYLLLALPLTLACFVSASERMTRLLLGLGLVLQTACLLLTGSRAGAAMLLVVLGVWLLLLARAGVLRGRGRQVGVGLALVAIAGLLASTPLLMRVAAPDKPASPDKPTGGTNSAVAGVAASADAQGHSGKFRQYTWTGTLRMARANPLAGTGIGSYETAYPRYATTGFTAHAHNSFLQWMAETGVPGVFFLLVVLASSSAFGTYVLFLNNPRRRSKARKPNTAVNADTAEDGTDESSPLLLFSTSPLPAPSLPYGFEEPRLLLAGLIAAVLSSTLHSLFDSDWSVVATGLTLSAIIGLLVAQARDIAPLATQTPRPLSKGMLAGCGAIALVLAWRGGTTYMARFDAAQGQEQRADFEVQAARQDSRARDSLQSAIESYQAASGFDPFDAELLLTLNGLYQTTGQPDKALQALEQAVRILPSGKTYYQLGQFHKRRALQAGAGSGSGQGMENPISLSGTNLDSGQSDPAELKAALPAFLRSREHDPHNLQTLRALAETYALAGNPAEAVQTYRDMTTLETTPVGTVRAVPEVIEAEFAYAHARLAQALLQQKREPEAVPEFAAADTLLKTYWSRRHVEMYQIIRADKRPALNTLYDNVLTGWQNALRSEGITGEEVRRAIAAEQAAFHADQQADDEAEKKAQSESGASEQGSIAP